MTMKPLRILEQPELHKIPIQPGETVTTVMQVADLFVSGETVSSVQSDNAAIAYVSKSGYDITLRLTGPANGVQTPVRVTINGSLGSLRVVSMVLIGYDPATKLALTAPNIFLRWMGAWQSGQAYLPSDLVLYGGLIYLALSSSMGAAPDINLSNWLAWAGTGGGGGSSTLIPDAGGSGRYAAFQMTWIGPGADDWQVEVKGVMQ